MGCDKFERGNYVYVKNGLFRGEYGRITQVLQKCHFYKIIINDGQEACVSHNELSKPKH